MSGVGAGRVALGRVVPTDATGQTYERTGAREVRATALGRGTHGVPDVRRLVEDQLRVAFPHRLWVAGQVGAVADGTPIDGDPDREGLRFWLHASTTDDEPFALHCVVESERLPAVREQLLHAHDAVLPDVVRPGRLARVGGLVRLEPVGGSVVLHVSELDPTPTSAALDDVRRQAVQAVLSAGLPDRQRRLPAPVAPLQVAVVGPAGSTCLEQLEVRLERAGLRTRVLPVRLTGDDAPSRLAEGLRAAGRRSDVVLLVRDQGQPLGLAWFDGMAAAQAVADCPVPVVTGLGGSGERTACDEVCFAVAPTAEAAADLVVGWRDDADRELARLGADVAAAAAQAAGRCRADLERAARDIEQSAAEAGERSARARRSWRLRLLVVSVLLAVAAVAAAGVAQQPLVLMLLLVPAALLGGALLWARTRARRGGRRKRMSERADDFASVLTRLRAVHTELTSTSSPERVAVLREEADGLLERGRSLLGTHLPPAPTPAPASST